MVFRASTSTIPWMADLLCAGLQNNSSILEHCAARVLVLIVLNEFLDHFHLEIESELEDGRK